MPLYAWLRASMPDWLAPPRPLRPPPIGGGTRPAMFDMLLCSADMPPTAEFVVLVAVPDAANV